MPSTAVLDVSAENDQDQSDADLPVIAAAAPAPAVLPSPNDGWRTEVLALTNQERALRGLTPLVRNAALDNAAQAYAGVMLQQNCFSHTCGPVPNFVDRERQAGYTSSWSMAAENIAVGYPDAAAVMRGWMNSPGHRENILNPNAREIGVGYAKGGSWGTWWVQDFAAHF